MRKDRARVTTAPSAEPPEITPTVASELLELLKLEGVSHIFGIPGGALISMLAALKADGDITYHTCRQETGAAFMADAYSRVSGGLAVVLVTSGPGATNALTGALNADASHTPMLVITGEVAEKFFGLGFLQEGAGADLDVVAVYGAALAYSELITSTTNFRELFESAMRTAWGTPRRATHLSLPGDVAGSPATGFSQPSGLGTYRVASSFVDSGGVESAVDAVVKAKRPLVMLGNSCRRPLEDDALRGEFVSAVERLAVPVMTSPDAKGVFPESHQLSLRNYGLAACRWPRHYIDDPVAGHYDALVVIGSSLGELATWVDGVPWSPELEPNGPLIQLDEDPSVLGRDYPITLGVVGESGALVRSFVQAANAVEVDPATKAEQDERRQFVADLRTVFSPFTDPEKRTSNSIPIKPQALARIISEAVPPGAEIMVDAGNCVGWCLHEMVIDPPTRIHSALTMGPMGFATAAVVGAKLAAPTRTCLAVVGDGGFLMQAGEVATAAQYNIGAIWVVLADHDLSMVSQGMAATQGDPSYDGYYKLGWANLGAVAQGLGAEASNTQSVEEVAAALDRAISGAEAGVPQVVVVAIDPTEAPPYNYQPPPPPPSAR
jgi:acetolactate synthase-1/2/3 large subunit